MARELLSSESLQFLTQDSPVRTFHHQVDYGPVAKDQEHDAREFVDGLMYQSDAPYPVRPLANFVGDLDNLIRYGSAWEAEVAERFDLFRWVKARRVQRS